MKANIGYIFVDDGYPEAEEYETNYVGYNLSIPGSYNRALKDAILLKKGTRLSDTLTFKNIPLDSERGRQISRNERHKHSGVNRIRKTLARLIASE